MREGKITNHLSAVQETNKNNSLGPLGRPRCERSPLDFWAEIALGRLTFIKLRVGALRGETR